MGSLDKNATPNYLSLALSSFYISIYLYSHLSIHLSLLILYLSLYCFIYLSLSLCLSISFYLSIYLSIHLIISPSLSIYQSFSLHLCIYVYCMEVLLNRWQFLCCLKIVPGIALASIIIHACTERCRRQLSSQIIFQYSVGLGDAMF